MIGVTIWQGCLQLILREKKRMLSLLSSSGGPIVAPQHRLLAKIQEEEEIFRSQSGNILFIISGA